MACGKIDLSHPLFLQESRGVVHMHQSCCGISASLWFEMRISRRQGARRHVAEKLILTQTHSRCHKRCFKDIATAGAGQRSMLKMTSIDRFSFVWACS